MVNQYPLCQEPYCNEPVEAFYQLGKRIYRPRCPRHQRRVEEARDNRYEVGYYINKQGYRFVADNSAEGQGRFTPEHRLVMERMLGRKLTRFESVHHINGIRHDNAEANLELWLGGIRYGQRAKQIVCPHCHIPYLLEEDGKP